MKKTLSILAVLSLGTVTFVAAESELLENVVYAQENEEVEENVEENASEEVEKEDEETEEEMDEETDEDEEADDDEVDPRLGQKLFAAFTQHSAVENYLFDINGLENNMVPYLDAQYQVEMPKFYPHQYLVKTSQFDDFAEVPEGMEFYLVLPNKINEQVVFGFNEDVAIVFVNPPFIPLYSSMISNGIEFDSETLLANQMELSDDTLDRIVFSPTNFETENLNNENFAKVWSLIKGSDVSEDEVFEVRRNLQYVNSDLRNNSYIYPDNTFEIRATTSEDNLVFTIQPDGGIMVYPDVPYIVVESDVNTEEATRAVLENNELYHVSEVSEIDVSDFVDQFQ